MYNIRKARIADVPKIHKLVNSYAEKKSMLPRSLSHLYDTIQGFFVAEYKRNIAGCCALGITWEDLAEIKSLAVAASHRKQNIGERLIDECVKEAKKLGIKQIFVLTYIPEYFRKFGFKKISRNKLPHKIWSECVHCPFFPDCNETPMIKKI